MKIWDKAGQQDSYFVNCDHFETLYWLVKARLYIHTNPVHAPHHPAPTAALIDFVRVLDIPKALFSSYIWVC
jgi:hypothetical protein